MLTPLDIENKRFAKQVVNGYNTDEIDEFLDQLLKDYELLYKENIELKNNVGTLNSEIAHYKSIENVLQNTLVVAQSTAEEVKENARKEAELILSNADAKVKDALADINHNIALKQIEYNEIINKFNVYKAKMESLLISQLDILKEQKQDV